MAHYFTERGATHEEAINRMSKKYGGRARLIMVKNVPARGLRGLFGKTEIELTCTLPAGEGEMRNEWSIKDEVNRAAILKNTGHKRSGPLTLKIDEESASGKTESMDRVLAEIQSLKQTLSRKPAEPEPVPFPVLDELKSILMDNDFDSGYVGKLTESLRESISAADMENPGKVHDAAAAMIAKSIQHSNLVRYRRKDNDPPQILVLVGPTGVGKTTTVAKLAAVSGLANGADVRIINIDNLRIGAQAQVETYGDIMHIPVLNADSEDELQTQIALASDADIILVDTFGKSPRDREQIEQMRRLIEVCGAEAQVHLAVSATTKTGDLRKIMEQFEIFGYSSVIITKLDETRQIGNIISVLSEKGCPVSYFTDGQTVPVDIALASPPRLLSRLSGLKYDEQKLLEKYPSEDITAAWR